MFFSYKTTIVLLLIYAFSLAAATLIEKGMGTLAAFLLVYHSPVFIILQFLLVMNFIGILLQKKLYKSRKPGFLILHFAFIVIFSGAFVSHLFGREGTFHLREGETSNQLVIETNRGITHKTLPFSLELVKFTVERYPGSSSPSSFESRLIVHDEGKEYEKVVAMNSVLDIKGYRFFQASYDEDEKGTILSVNNDWAGTAISYTGYFLLTVGFIFILLSKNSRFQQLAVRLKEMQTHTKQAIVTILFLLFVSVSFAQNTESSPMEFIQNHKIGADSAKRFGSLPMLSRSGRVEPVNTFSSEILRKLHKSETIAGMNSDQFLLSVLSYPDAWMKIPFIAVPNREIAAHFTLSEGAISYLEAFDKNGNYKFSKKLMEIYHKSPAERNRFDKDLLKLDEQINILHQLVNDPHAVTNQVIDYRKDNNTITVNNKKIKAELFYNKADVFRYCKIGYFLLGGCLLIASSVFFLKPQKRGKTLIRLLIAGILLCFFVHLFGIGLRGYIAGYAPWSNAYETMVFVSWVTVLAGICFTKRSSITLALATLFGGIILFVSGLNWLDPQISPLVPVLKSPWLMFHVAVIVAAYGFAGISCLLGLTNLTLLLITCHCGLDPQSPENTCHCGLDPQSPENTCHCGLDPQSPENTCHCGLDPQSPEKGRRWRIKSAMTTTKYIKELSIINEMAIWIGLALLSVGIFLGAVWANESWGRYWGWDPKETWALITMLAYAITVHLRLVKKWDNVWLFNIASVLSFLTVLMTFIGVNYFLSGMHSYQ